MDPLVPLSRALLLGTVSILHNTRFLVYLGLILIFVICSAFFSATETALNCCNRVRMKVKAENGNKTAKLALKLIDMYDQSLITLLIGNNIVNTAASVIATSAAIILFANEGIASVVSTVVMTILIFIFGETFPKNFAKNNPDRFISVCCYPLIVLHVIFYPIMLIFNFLLWSFKKIFRVNNNDNIITEDEFQGIIETVEEEGVLDEEESDIIQAAVDFGDITVNDVLTKIDDIKAINIKNVSRKQLMKDLLDIDFSRIPVYEDNINNITGILHVRKILKAAMKSRNFSIRSAISEPCYVASTTKLDDMTEFFKEKKIHMAIVKDDNNKIIGLVTMEDVLEKLIGHIPDEDEIGGDE